MKANLVEIAIEITFEYKIDIAILDTTQEGRTFNWLGIEQVVRWISNCLVIGKLAFQRLVMTLHKVPTKIGKLAQWLTTRCHRASHVSATSAPAGSTTTGSIMVESQT